MLSLDFINNEYEDTKTPAQKVCESIAIDILTGILPDGKLSSKSSAKSTR